MPLGALIVWRYSIQGLGFSSLAMLAGVAEMVARTAVAIVLVPILGYFGAELSNPAHGSRPACSCTLRIAGPAANWTTACWLPGSTFRATTRRLCCK